MEDFAGGIASKFIGGAIDTLYSIPQGFLANYIGNIGFGDRLKLSEASAKRMIDYQNAYSAPKAQMERLAAAGLNPNLIYGNLNGNSASASQVSPGSVSIPGYHTGDVATSALALAQMKAAQAQKDDLSASARLKNAEASKVETELGYYPLLLELSVEQGQRNLDKTAADIEVSKATINYQDAASRLALADEALKRQEIDLFEYRKQQIIAQTYLYVSEAKLNEAKEDYTRSLDYGQNIQNTVDALVAKYQQYFYGEDGNIRQMAEQERTKIMNEMKTDAEHAAATLDIQGHKSTQWINWITGQIGRLLGGTGNVMSGTAALQNAGAKKAVVSKIKL